MSEHYSSKYNKHIYILGDVHTTKGRVCPPSKTLKNSINLANFLGYLPTLNNPDGTPKLIDYFFEIDFKNKLRPYVKPYGQSYIKYINEVFENCLKLDKELCQYKNVRMHYADVRRTPELLPFDEHYYYLEYIDKYYETKEKKYFDYIKDYLETFDKPSLDKLLSKGINEWIKISKVYKQLDNLEFPEVGAMIKQESEKEVKKLLKVLTPDFIRMTLEVGYDIINIPDYFPSKETAFKIFKMNAYVIDGFSHIMDMYLFSRMFRKFKKTKTMSEPPTNIVVYVGDWHANNYRKLLDKLGFTHKESKSKTKGIDFQCVNISNFVQPFFSEHNLKPNEVYA